MPGVVERVIFRRRPETEDATRRSPGLWRSAGFLAEPPACSGSGLAGVGCTSWKGVWPSARTAPERKFPDDFGPQPLFCSAGTVERGNCVRLFEEEHNYWCYPTVFAPPLMIGNLPGHLGRLGLLRDG